MPAGQAHTTWFPELKEILMKKWDSKLTIPEQFDLVNELSKKLNQIRADLNIKPPMMWCPKCKKRTRSRFTDVSITAMYYALKRFEICEDEEVKILLKDWIKYSKSMKIDIYGKNISDKKNDDLKHC